MKNGIRCGGHVRTLVSTALGHGRCLSTVSCGSAGGFFSFSRGRDFGSHWSCSGSRAAGASAWGITACSRIADMRHRGRFECFLTTCGALALQGGPLFWVATHRIHHQNSDRNGDPHSPRDGWWWAHAGWLVRGDAMRNAALAPYVPDLRRDPFHCWLEKWHIVPLLVLSVILAAWASQRRRVPGGQPCELGHLPADRSRTSWHLVGKFRRAHLGQPPFQYP